MQRSLLWKVLALVVLTVGCTSPRQWYRNGFKVGPNIGRPKAAIAEDWIDHADVRVRSNCDNLAGWWTVFNDPQLNNLVAQTYAQNLTLRQAGYRVLAARAQLGFARGSLFPQRQDATGSYQRFGIGDQFFDRWNASFNLSWELDFWGRFRRAIVAADANLGASVADYDDVLVTLLADTANNYVRYRTNQERIRLLKEVIEVQEAAVRFTSRRLEAGATTSLDNAQAISNLKQSEAQLNLLEIDRRLAQNQLCILMGMPVSDLSPLLDAAQHDIPRTPEFVVVGIPADLLRRRPDVRRAEFLAAAQGQQIGIAVADLYPAFAINGTLGWQASNFSDLFNSKSLNSNVGPVFQWNLLNYGRIRNNVRFQDARFRELVAGYQNTVLQADLEVENGIVTFLQAQERAKSLDEAVRSSQMALDVVVAQYQAEVSMEKVDFNRYTVIVQTLIQQQDQWAQARGQIALGLIDTYRALGGGWQIRLGSVPNKIGVLSEDPNVSQPADEAPQAGQELVPLPPANED